MKSRSKKIEIKSIALVVLLLLLILEIAATWNIGATLDKKASESKELARLPELKIVIISDSSCGKCFDSGNIISLISGNANITSHETFEFTSLRASQLIEKFAIEKIPAVIVSGETNKERFVQISGQLGGRLIGGSVVFSDFPPYIDVKTKKIRGLVTLTSLLDQSCNNCYNVSVHRNALAGFGIVFDNETAYDINSEKGKEILEKYNITKIPTVIMSPEASVYLFFQPVWNNVGTIEKDGYYVFRNMDVIPGSVYRDLATGKTQTA